MISKIKSNKTLILNILYYGLALAFMLGFALLQPYSWPPDEDPRYRIVVFIRNTLTLPLGEEPEIAIFGFGGSYAYSPMLPYIIMGFWTRFVRLFTSEPYKLLIAARLVNVCSGILMAYFTRKCAKKLFDRETMGWVFSVMVMFLPQLLFLHTYVNVDSFALTSGSIILYGSLRGREDDWSVKSCIILATGVIICGLSYYNAYGSVVLGMLLYMTSYIGRFDAARFFKKAGFITAIVLVGIGWWFARNLYIHNGDLLGLRSQYEYAVRTALPDYNPETRQTVHSTGATMIQMVLENNYLRIVRDSFIASFESMTLYTYLVTYGWYVRIFKLGALLLLIPVGVNGKLIWDNKGDVGDFEKPKTVLGGLSAQRPETSQIMIGGPHADTSATFKEGDVGDLEKTGKIILHSIGFHISMVMGIIIPVALSLIYSYYYDYQPQGRYIMPMVMPFMYYITLGYNKGVILAEFLLKRITGMFKNKLGENSGLPEKESPEPVGGLLSKEKPASGREVLSKDISASADGLLPKESKISGCGISLKDSAAPLIRTFPETLVFIVIALFYAGVLCATLKGIILPRYLDGINLANQMEYISIKTENPIVFIP